MGVLDSANPARRSLTGQFLKPSGALRESFPRYGSATNSTSSLTSTNAQGHLIVLNAGDVITSITFCTGSTGLTTPTHQWFWLADVNRNQLRVTSDDLATAWAANSLKTLSLSASYTVLETGLYYVGISVVAATAGNLSSVGGNAGVATASPVLGFRDTSNIVSTPILAPSQWTLSTVVSSMPWFYVSGS